MIPPLTMMLPWGKKTASGCSSFCGAVSIPEYGVIETFFRIEK
jgi:hypothetical protein